MSTTEDALLGRCVEYVQAHGESEAKELGFALTEARALISNYVGAYKVATEVNDRAIVEVTAELFYRKMSRNGVSEFAGTDLAPFRIARDPMKAAYPILAQYMPVGLA